MSNLIFFFVKQKTAYEMLRSLGGSEMCIRDSAIYRKGLLEIILPKLKKEKLRGVDICCE